MLSYENIIKGEYVGLNVEINKTSGTNEEMIKCLIIDESKKTFKIENENGIKTIIKKNSIITIRKKDKSYNIIGDILVGKPEERVKKKIRKKW